MVHTSQRAIFLNKLHREGVKRELTILCSLSRKAIDVQDVCELTVCETTRWRNDRFPICDTNRRNCTFLRIPGVERIEAGTTDVRFLLSFPSETRASPKLLGVLV